ncbi:uncharacterized protein [Aegilops tauschii subsp. strangulata]|uniref:uncharacterized protein n=1 Tax=Aegilops tauschii subsp. strangulata TaxID=200361 RepID=UPI003CC84D7C
MGVIQAEEQLSQEALDAYRKLFDKPLAPHHIKAVATLFDPDGAEFDEPAHEGFTALSLPECFMLEQSKLEVVDAAVVCQVLGSGFDDFDFLPDVGTHGGILMACKPDVLCVNIIHKGEFSITANVLSLSDDKAWAVTSVYGPQEVDDKIRFLQEIEHIGQQMQLPRIINGDFNLVKGEAERSSGRANRRMVAKFRHTINCLGLHDMPLVGRKFTWCNDQQRLIITRLDWVLFNNDWEEIYPISDLLALSSNISDHCPLMLSCAAGHPRARRFRFENFWCKLPGFLETVKRAWEEEVDSSDPAKVLSIELQRTAKALRSWGQKKQGSLEMQFQISNDVILRLDTAQETRDLSLEERRLKAFLKGKCLALAALERIRVRQRARVRDLREGDANSKYFHLKANGRRRKTPDSLLERWESNSD